MSKKNDIDNETPAPLTAVKAEAAAAKWYEEMETASNSKHLSEKSRIITTLKYYESIYLEHKAEWNRLYAFWQRQLAFLKTKLAGSVSGTSNVSKEDVSKLFSSVDDMVKKK